MRLTLHLSSEWIIDTKLLYGARTLESVLKASICIRGSSEDLRDSTLLRLPWCSTIRAARVYLLEHSRQTQSDAR